MNGYNGSVLAYGQTSSGKTHTMSGIMYNEEQRGIIPRMVSFLFNQIDIAAEEIEFSVKVSMVEIYMEKIRDLVDITKTNLKISEDPKKGIFIADVTETYVTEAKEIFDLMRIGNDNRSVGCTDMNAESSRSHSVFILTVHAENA